MPLQPVGYVEGDGGALVWIEPSYHDVVTVLTHPA